MKAEWVKDENGGVELYAYQKGLLWRGAVLVDNEVVFGRLYTNKSSAKRGAIRAVRRMKKAFSELEV